MRIVHYPNQFFAGIGGEDRAEPRPGSRAGAVGPGLALQHLLAGEAEIAGTVFCGDGLVADGPDALVSEIVALIERFAPECVRLPALTFSSSGPYPLVMDCRARRFISVPLGLITNMSSSAPYEELRLKGK